MLKRTINPLWRQGLGILLIVFGLASSVFYYIEMHAIQTQAKQVTTTLADPKPEAPVVSRVTATTHVPNNTESAPSLTGKVRLSTATQSELETLPKIGPKKAQQIIAYREQVGFKSTRDLMNIKGIGQKTFEELEPLIDL